MYDREVDVPRLVGSFQLESVSADTPGAILDAARRVTDSLGVPFNSVGLNLYRDGRDSVAPHNDHLNEIAKGFPIALVSLGAKRRMTIRAKAEPRACHSHRPRARQPVRDGLCNAAPLHAWCAEDDGTRGRTHQHGVPGEAIQENVVGGFWYLPLTEPPELFQRPFQRSSAPPHIRPHVAYLRDSIGHVTHGECARVHLATLDLFPCARRRYRRAAPGAHGVRGRERGAVTVSPGVHVDPTATIDLAEFLCQAVGREADEQRSHRVRKPRNDGDVCLSVNG